MISECPTEEGESPCGTEGYACLEPETVERGSETSIEGTHGC